MTDHSLAGSGLGAPVRLRLGALARLLPLLVLAACGSPKPRAAAPTAEKPMDDGCGMVTADRKEIPESLAVEFMRRDNAGEFLAQSAWFDSVTMCPKLEGAKAAFSIVGDHETRWLPRTPGHVQLEISELVLGTVTTDSAGHQTYTTEGLASVDTIAVDSTTHGWRVRSPALRLRLTPEAAAAKAPSVAAAIREGARK